MKDQPAPQSRSDNGINAREKGENKICRSGLQGWGSRKEKAWGPVTVSVRRRRQNFLFLFLFFFYA